MRSNLTSRGRRITIAVVAVAIAAFVFRSEILTLLIEPIGWLLWAGWRLVASVDQGICWALIVLTCFVIVLRFLPPSMGAPEEPAPALESQGGRAGRLDYWEELATRAVQSQEGLTAFQASLDGLADAVAESTKQSPRQRPQATGAEWHQALLRHLLAGRRRRAELRAIEDRLSWMESALEIKHEDSVD